MFKPGMAAHHSSPYHCIQQLAKSILHRKSPKQKMFNPVPDARMLSIFRKGKDDCLKLCRNEAFWTASLVHRAQWSARGRVDNQGWLLMITPFYMIIYLFVLYFRHFSLVPSKTLIISGSYLWAR